MGLLDTLAKPMPGEEDDDEAPSMDSAKSKKVRAMKRFESARKAGNFEGMAEAFADAFAACESGYTEETEDDELEV